MAKLLWEPSEERKKNTNIMRFMETVNSKYGQKFSSYDELYEWSVNNIADCSAPKKPSFAPKISNFSAIGSPKG